jgi:hypothetical protein
MRVVLSLCVAAAVGCGSGTQAGNAGSSGTATVNGTIHGRQITAADASSAVVPVTWNGFSLQAGGVVISSAANICATLTASKQPRSWQSLVLGVAQQQGATFAAPTGPGVFNVITSAPTDSKVALVYFRTTDDRCADLGPNADAAATSGTVTLTSVGATYTGSFEVTFDTGEHVTGSFRAPACPGVVPVVQSLLGSGTPPACE